MSSISRRGFLGGVLALSALITIPGAKLLGRPKKYQFYMDGYMRIDNDPWMHVCVTKTRWRTKRYIDGERVSEQQLQERMKGMIVWTEERKFPDPPVLCVGRES